MDELPQIQMESEGARTEFAPFSTNCRICGGSASGRSLFPTVSSVFSHPGGNTIARSYAVMRCQSDGTVAGAGVGAGVAADAAACDACSDSDPQADVAMVSARQSAARRTTLLQEAEGKVPCLAGVSSSSSSSSAI